MTESNDKQRKILFSPPDITEREIEAVAEAMRSGWITTGPRTKLFEQRLCAFTQAAGLVCFGSATQAAETALRALGIGPGDEVITTAYTYTATCAVICHVGATPVLVDTLPGSFEIDYDAVGAALTEKTKAVIPVDLAGRMCDYDRLFAVLAGKRELWHPANDLQAHFDRVIVVADAAHALGATYKGAHCGSVADFTSFSFHAVKNLTTAEGGALSWREAGFDNDEFYRQLMLWSLHGQSKDALSKNTVGGWEYDVTFPGYKCNMTDIMASIGLVQLDRYPDLLARRRALIGRYECNLADAPVTLLEHFTDDRQSSGHLMLVRIDGAKVPQRNAIIQHMALAGIASNVHYKPLPLLTAYRNLGFDIADYPHAYAQYENEITLPLHTLLSDDDVNYICDGLKAALAATLEAE